VPRTLYQPIGAFGGQTVGALTGLLKTTDGGNTWSQLGNSSTASGGLQGLSISAVGARGNTILASTQSGVYLSSDGGASFQNISGLNGLNAGPAFDLISDPSDVNRFYVAVGGTTGGVFRTDNLGGNWTDVTDSAIGALVSNSTDNMKLAVSAAAPQPVYVAITNSGQLAGILRSQDAATATGAATWVAMDLPQTLDASRTITNASNATPIVITTSGNHGYLNGDRVRITGVTGNTAANGDFTISVNSATPNQFTLISSAGNANYTGGGTANNIQGILHGRQSFPNLTLYADPGDANIVYIAGDRQDFLGGDSSIGATAFSARIFRGDASVAASGPGAVVTDPTHQWTPLTNSGTSNSSSPHADSRAMAFDSNNTLIYTGDGGIFRETSPRNASGRWLSMNGNLQVTQFYDISYDSIFNVIMGGAQDTGTPLQTSAGAFVYTDQTQADGPATLIDNFTLAGTPRSIRYLGLTRVDYSDATTRFGSAVNVFPTGGLTGLVNVGPVVLNAIAPPSGESTRLVIAGTAPMVATGTVYESTNAGIAANTAAVTWTQVPTGAGFVSGNAIAAGGRRNGIDNPDVLYVASGNQIFLRTTAGGTLNATAGQPAGAGSIIDIALDPNDWNTAFVTDGIRVYMTTDAGTNWTNVTGNLNNSPSLIPRMGVKLAVIADAGVDALLFSGTNGVMRMLTTAPGAWSEFGAGLPNAAIPDMQYNAADDVLVVGTFGRGAWEVSNASATAFSTGVLQITGDTDFAGEDDTIRLVVDGNNSSLLDVFLNGALSQFQLSTIQQINVDGLGGKDDLMVDSSNGLINVANGIRYDGGTGSDRMELQQTGGPTRTSDTYSVGPAIGSGVSTIVGSGTAGMQVVSFENLSPVLDLVPAFSLTVNATANDNAINYAPGTLLTQGLVSIDEHEPIEFANKTSLVINAGAGQDTISLNNPNTPTGLSGITINGGDPTSGDMLIVTGTGGAVNVNTATSTITGATGAGGAVSIGYSGIESLNLPAGIGDLTLTTTDADDTVAVTPGLTTGANSGTVSSSGAVPQIAFVNSGTFTANLAGGNDALIVNGSSLADTVTVSGTAVAIMNRHTVNYSGVEALTVNGNAASDIFTVTPAATVAMFIDGGDPVSQLPGDVLNIVAGGASVSFNAGPGADEGSFVVGANQPVSFDHIESIGKITGGTSAAINGTNGPDAITVIARDGTYAPAVADGVQDFTVSVNGGPALLFVDVPTLAINAGSGNDVVTLEAPAPNNAAWNVSVAVNGGTPATDTDQLIVQTPGTGAESVVYTPGTSDSGTLNITSSNLLVTNVTITGIDVLSYDGQADNDSLTIVGTIDPDTIVHTPGANDQAGTFQVNSLLALSYQNLGSGGSLTGGWRSRNGHAGLQRHSGRRSLHRQRFRAGHPQLAAAGQHHQRGNPYLAGSPGLRHRHPGGYRRKRQHHHYRPGCQYQRRDNDQRKC
jgi:photosystem II stability/assembly factor-like uncharacterized protein